jgi:hypothetical protein
LLRDQNHQAEHYSPHPEIRCCKYIESMTLEQNETES